jgi:hypothetical protein
MNEARYLPPRLLQLVGLGLLVGFAVFWALTGASRCCWSAPPGR